jgi:hypothetical protein
MFITSDAQLQQQYDMTHWESSRLYDSVPSTLLLQIPAFSACSGRSRLARGRQHLSPRYLKDPHHAVVTLRCALKAAWLLQFLRPSLRSAVTASAVVADEDCSSGTRWANLVGATRVRSGIT